MSSQLTERIEEEKVYEEGDSDEGVAVSGNSGEGEFADDKEVV